MRPTALILAFAFCAIVSNSASAQQKETPKHTLRILPLGDPPPFKQEIRENVRYELPAEKGTVPPHSVSLALSPPTDNSEPEPMDFRLRLNTISAPRTFPLPKDRQVSVTGDDSAPWSKVSLTDTTSTLALVWRGGKLWNTARALSIPDSPPGDLNKTVRFVNLTVAPMGITFGTDKVRLESGKTLVKTLTSNQPTVVMIQYPGRDGQLQTCLSTQVESNARTFQQFFIYAADSQSSRAPVKVLSLAEPR